MRHLAIDLGDRRIGLAMSDAGGRFAQPHEVLQVTDPRQAIDPIAQLARQEAVERLVVGLPLNMDGSVGPRARQTIAWGEELARKAGVAVVYVDERLTSFDAAQQLNDRKRGGEKLTRKRRKEQLDALAAATFLQDYLDGRLTAIDPGQSARQ